MSTIRKYRGLWFGLFIVAVMAAIAACDRSAPERHARAETAAAAGADGITIGAPVYYAGLTVFPLYRKGVQNVEYKTLEEALADGSVEVRELDQGASVPELQVVNKSADKVIIIGGEELVGAKQNRIMNTTMILDGDSKTTIPVSCVEHGRWNEVSDTFSKGEMATAKMRAANAAGVQKSVKQGGGYAAGQQRVWNDVEDLNKDLGVSSGTGAMNDGIKAQEEKLAAFAAAFKLDPSAAGYIAFAGDKALGMDLFATPQVFRHKWDELLKSVALEVLRLDTPPAAAALPAAQAFLDETLNSVGEAYAPPGLGDAQHIQSDEVVGNVVRYKGDIAHLSAFPAPPEDNTEPYPVQQRMNDPLQDDQIINQDYTPDVQQQKANPAPNAPQSNGQDATPDNPQE